jgi:phosphoglycerate kinase
MPVAVRLGQMLHLPVRLVTDWVDGNFEVKPGEVVLLENCRVNKGEKKNNDELAQKMAKLCDIYVNDAFGTAHRAEATTHGMARFAPVACAGVLMGAEIDALGKALHKSETPAGRHRRRLQGVQQADHSAVAGQQGRSTDRRRRHRQHLPARLRQAHWRIAGRSRPGQGSARHHGHDEASVAPKCRLPTDVVVADEVSALARANKISVDDVSAHDRILDVGPKTAVKLAEIIAHAGTIVWNGPVGVFELPQFAGGTKMMASAIAHSEAFSIAGGGDTLAAIAKFHIADDVGYISTGGGAFLEFLEGKTLPAIAVLEERAKG